MTTTDKNAESRREEIRTQDEVCAWIPPGEASTDWKTTVVRRNREYIPEGGNVVQTFLMVDMSQYGPYLISSRGCTQFRLVAFL